MGFEPLRPTDRRPNIAHNCTSGFAPTPGTLVARVIETMQPVQMEDMSKSRAYLDGDPVTSPPALT